MISLRDLSALTLAGGVAVLAAGLLAFAGIVAFRFLRRGAARFWSAPGALALCLLPLAVGAAFAGLLLRRMMAGMALTGSGGVAAIAAGSAEALMPMLAGPGGRHGPRGVRFSHDGGRQLAVERPGRERPAGMGAPRDVAVLARLHGRSPVAHPLDGGAPERLLGGPVRVARAHEPRACGRVRAHRRDIRVGPGRPVPGAARPLRHRDEARVARVPGALRTALPRRAVGDLGRARDRSWRPRSPACRKASCRSRWPSWTCRSSRRRLFHRLRQPRTVPSHPSSPTVPVPSPLAGPAASRGSRRHRARRSRRSASADRSASRRRSTTSSPIYPEDAKQARVQGVVILEATISPRGDVTSVKVLRGIPLLDQSAIDAVKQWVYTPTLLERRAGARHHDGHGQLQAAVSLAASAIDFGRVMDFARPRA